MLTRAWETGNASKMVWENDLFKERIGYGEVQWYSLGAGGWARESGLFWTFGKGGERRLGLRLSTLTLHLAQESSGCMDEVKPRFFSYIETRHLL
jgi:hypothetical protein